MRGASPRWRWLAVGSGTLMAIAGIICACTWSAIFDSVLSHQVALTPDSRAYQEWLEPSVPLYFDIYLFNWTNAQQFPGEIPWLQELGPYRFLEHRRRVNITWHPENASVSYRTFKWFEFIPDGSAGSLQDQVTTVNAVAASAVYRNRYRSPFIQKILALSLAASNHKISVTKSAGELLFDGYSDSLLDLAKVLPASMTGGAPPVDRFGWFYQRNNSIDTDGYVTVSTGNGDGKLPGQILLWNDQERLPYYYGDCSKIYGSVGEFMPRNLTEKSTLNVFLSDLCRSVDMSYSESGDIGGLLYHKYILKESSFDNSSLDPRAQSCFCSAGCEWGGVMNVSECRYGSPSFVSLPHFLHADGDVLRHVRGLAPDTDKHEFYFAVEPRLGVPLDVAARFQVNLYLEPNPNLALFQDIPRMLFPILWIEQRVQIGGEIIADLRHARSILDWGSTVCAGLALFFAILVTTFTCCTKKSQYAPPLDLTMSLEKPKDEAEVKLKPM